MRDAAAFPDSTLELSIRRSRPCGGEDMFIVGRSTLASLALALRTRDPEECRALWRGLCKALTVDEGR